MDKGMSLPRLTSHVRQGHTGHLPATGEPGTVVPAEKHRAVCPRYREGGTLQ